MRNCASGGGRSGRGKVGRDGCEAITARTIAGPHENEVQWPTRSLALFRKLHAAQSDTALNLICVGGVAVIDQ
jgi:hypothetical protein